MQSRKNNLECAVRQFVTSPQGKARVWIGVFFLGLPVLFISSWLFNLVDWEWHISGAARRFCEILLGLMLLTTFGVGIYCTLFRTAVTIDRVRGSVTRRTGLCGIPVYCRVWSIAEFQRIEVRHYAYGDGPGDAFQTDVGLRHGGGSIVWLRSFLSESAAPTPEAKAFAEELGEGMGLPCES